MFLLFIKNIYICIFLDAVLTVKCIKLKKQVTSFGRAAFSHSSHFDINIPWSLGYIRKLAFRSLRGNYSTPGFVSCHHTAIRNFKLAQTRSLSLSGNKFTHWARWSSGSAFDCRSRDKWFESYTGLKGNSLGTKMNIRGSIRPKVWIRYPERAVSMQVWYSWTPYFGCILNGCEIYSSGRSEH